MELRWAGYQSTVPGTVHNPKARNLTVIQGKEKQRIFTCMKLESANVYMTKTISQLSH